MADELETSATQHGLSAGLIGNPPIRDIVRVFLLNEMQSRKPRLIEQFCFPKMIVIFEIEFTVQRLEDAKTVLITRTRRQFSLQGLEDSSNYKDSKTVLITRIRRQFTLQRLKDNSHHK